MGKFPETNMVNYGVDNEGYLYLSNQKIARYDNAIHNNLVRNDIVFDEFTSEEINEFFVLMELLRRNEISSCYKEPLLGRFIFDYRSEGVTSSDKVRHVMIVTSKTDTLDGNFLKYFKVLDSYERLILFKLNRR